MGGNGARSASSRRIGVGGGGGGFGAAGLAFGLGANTTQQQQNSAVNGQASGNPTPPSTTVDQFQKMSNRELVNYLSNLKNNVVMPPLDELPNCDTQRLIYDLGLNDQPRVVSQAEFAKLKGQTYYRGVYDFVDRNGTILATADDIVNQTFYGGATRIGAGVSGDGFYFAKDRGTAESYARNGQNGRVMQMKLDMSKVKGISVNNLQTMFAREPAEVRRAFENMSTVGNQWSTGYLSAYAVHKGYNTIIRDSVGFAIPITRDVMILSDSTYRR